MYVLKSKKSVDYRSSGRVGKAKCCAYSSVAPTKFKSRYFPSETAPRVVTFPQTEKIWSCGPNSSSTMVSRRKILSRSRDGLNSDFTAEEEDVWFQKDRLFKDHVQEVLNKWRQIDDEIWAKIIVMERNRRVAKAYARAPVLTINGSDDGFDGYRIGLCGFDNPMRDAKTEEIKKHIGNGVKIKMDDAGNIMIKRVSKSNVYVKGIKTEENGIACDITLSGSLLDMEKPVKLFDMKKFASNVSKELSKVYPDSRRLESQCISAICFVKDSSEILDCSCWVMVINIVALDMLRSKWPPSASSKRHSLDKVGERRQMPLPLEEDDPYTIPLASDSRTSEQFSKESKPPKLPPRDLNRVPVPMPDYDDWKRDKPLNKMHQQSGYKDDPYCCGMKARVPNFGRKSNAQYPINQVPPVRKSHSSGYLSFLRQNDRMATNSSRESDSDDYSRVYGRKKSTGSAGPGVLYVGEWE